MFMRKNPKGVHFERWRHTYGCGKWFLAARCTATLEVFGTYPAQVSEPPPTSSQRSRPAAPAGSLTGRPRNEHAPRQGRPVDRPHRARRIHLQRQALKGFQGDTLASAFWPTTRCWSAAASSITARAASSPRDRKSRTRWSTSARGPGWNRTSAPPRPSFSTASGSQPEPLAHPGIRRRRGEQLRRPLPARGLLLQDLHPPAPVLEARVRADHPPLRGPWQSAHRRRRRPLRTGLRLLRRAGVGAGSRA
jgi:hypothetical protein